MADIRRNIQEVGPNTFVQQGVVDTSASTIVGGLAQGALEVDKQLALKRAGSAFDMLNAQYVVGSPAAATQTDPSVTDSTPLSPEDNKSLNDFSSILDTNARALDQGRMNNDSYRLRGERLLRVAIARRPGLAQEFRQLAAQRLGTDVLGAEVQFLAQQESMLGKAGAAAAEDADKKKWKLYDDETAQFAKAGFVGYTAYKGPDDPAYQEWKAKIFPAFMAKAQSSQAVELAQQQVTLTNTQKEANRDAQNVLWNSKARDILASVPATAQAIRTQLSSQGLDNDPTAVRQAISTALTGLDERIADLQVSGANGTVSQDVYSGTLDRLNSMRSTLQNTISGASDKELLGTWKDLVTAEEIKSAYSDDEYRRASVLLNDLPDSVAAQLQAKMGKNLTLVVSNMIADTGDPSEQARYAGAMVNQLVSGILPDGSSTPPDARAVDRLGESLIKAGTAFVVQPDTDFRADQFTKNPANNAAGFIQNINNNMKTLSRSLPEGQKQELVATIAAANAKQSWLLFSKMVGAAPGLRGKVQLQLADGNPNIFVAKQGVDVNSFTEAERAVLRQYNTAAQVQLVKSTVQGLTGASSKDATDALKTALLDTQAIRQQSQPKPQQRAQQGSQRPSSASGPQAGTVRSFQGKTYRFKGGANIQANWEEING